MNRGTELVATNGKVWVSSQYKRSGVLMDEEHNENLIEVDSFGTDPAYVKVSLGMTVNLGNFESLRVDAGVTLPCYKEEIDDAYDKAYSIAEKQLFSKVNEAKASV